MHFRRPGKLKVIIEIAPLVDIVFLLVIFFAVSTSFLESSGMKLDLPASTSTAEREAEEIAVSLAADGRLEFRDEPTTEADLPELLKQAMEETGKKIVVLRADEAASHGNVVRIMDLVKGAGAEALTVAARPVEE